MNSSKYNSKYNLILCELHNTIIHGIDKSSDPNIQTHYLVFERYKPFSEDYFNEIEQRNLDILEPEEINDEETEMQSDIQILKRAYSIQHNITSPIRNYSYIVSRPNYIQPEIGEIIILPTLEEIAILKTFWIRIIQKKWKKIFQQRKNILKQRLNPSSIYYRQISCLWPPNCNYLPGLNGLFYCII
jgi:hypothetical protein